MGALSRWSVLYYADRVGGQAMKDFIRGVVIGTGMLIILGALGASDNLTISFGECLIRCLIGMIMIASAIWIPRITQAVRLHKQTKEEADNHAA